MIVVKKADASDVAKIAPLYLKYLEFYQVDVSDKDPEAFIKSRIENEESVVYYATDESGQTLGFAQLYPLFCSLEMKKIWLLYDLYVDSSQRKRGIGERLLEQADLLAKETDSAFVMLNTGIDNKAAQSVYEKHGYVRDVKFYNYVHMLK
ncbi:GNAT family N-acetyltransferase [Vibrio owensii]|uniref:GNAT family N-acetyltransferase n=1 Tax=Vibrio owensii TaxID=696485 RepID=UPI000996B544|nr:GNAT family N-acetyltransferase [Vibrio owensii]AQW59520.1 GNAT family N-acetyltransferase [Vibrio owensii]